MELNKKNTKQLMFLITFTVLLLIGIYRLDVLLAAVSFVIGILKPFIIGGCIAFILGLPLKFIEEKILRKGKTQNKFLNKVRRPLGIVLSLIFVFGILFIVFFTIIPELSNTIGTLYTTVQDFIPKAQVWVNEKIVEYPEINQYFDTSTFDWANISSKLMELGTTIFSGIWTSASSAIAGIVSTVTNLLIGFVFALYLLGNKEKLSVQGKKLLYSFIPSKRADRIVYILQLTHRTFAKYTSGQCVEAVILGTMFFVTLTILRYPYALLIGVLIAFTALIPYFGAFIGSAISLFLIFMINPVQALWFILIFNVLQQIEGNLIYPYVVGGSVGLPSIWVLFAVTVGGSLMGVIGMIIFIPIFSVLYTLLRENVNIRLTIRRVPKEKYAYTDKPLEPRRVSRIKRNISKKNGNQEEQSPENKA